MELMKILVVLIVSDNHQKNIISLLSILKQDYPDIMLVVYDDATCNFSNEHFVNNLFNHPININQIVIQENKYPTGIYNIIKDICNKYDAEYFITLNSGNEFFEKNTLSELISKFSFGTDTVSVIANTDIINESTGEKSPVLSDKQVAMLEIATPEMLERLADEIDQWKHICLINKMDYIRELINDTSKQQNDEQDFNRWMFINIIESNKKILTVRFTGFNFVNMIHDHCLPEANASRQSNIITLFKIKLRYISQMEKIKPLLNLNILFFITAVLLSGTEKFGMPVFVMLFSYAALFLALVNTGLVLVNILFKIRNLLRRT